MYYDAVGKFLQHFLLIAQAMNLVGGDRASLWNEADGFFYDVLDQPSGPTQIPVRSLVGVVALFAVQCFRVDRSDGGEGTDFATTAKFTDLNKQLEWFRRKHPELVRNEYASVEQRTDTAGGDMTLVSMVDEAKLRRILALVLDEDELLGEFGVRSLSRAHAASPVQVRVGDAVSEIRYEPAESSSGMFGGNSNWRGPIWFPMNVLLIESLRRYHAFYGDRFTIECPTRSGRQMTLEGVAAELSRRLIRLFERDSMGRRPVNGGFEQMNTDPYWKDLVLFYEYFHGDNGAGIGASHQTGWTALVANLIAGDGHPRIR